MPQPRLNVRTIRTALGFSQEALGKHLGVSWVTVSRWENGHTQPTPHLYARLVALRQDVLAHDRVVRLLLSVREIDLIVTSLRSPALRGRGLPLANRLRDSVRLSTIPLGS